MYDKMPNQECKTVEEMHEELGYNKKLIDQCRNEQKKLKNSFASSDSNYIELDNKDTLGELRKISDIQKKIISLQKNKKKLKKYIKNNTTMFQRIFFKPKKILRAVIQSFYELIKPFKRYSKEANEKHKKEKESVNDITEENIKLGDKEAPKKKKNTIKDKKKWTRQVKTHEERKRDKEKEPTLQKHK